MDMKSFIEDFGTGLDELRARIEKTEKIDDDETIDYKLLSQQQESNRQHVAEQFETLTGMLEKIMPKEGEKFDIMNFLFKM
jgi:hypothetical protein